MAFSEQTRRKIFDNAKGKCESCGKQLVYQNHTEGEPGAWEAHHKTAVRSGGSDAPSNGKALCLDCHKKTF
jgi:5-methylcytosine-specific restriction endonuclease McrA